LTSFAAWYARNNIDPSNVCGVCTNLILLRSIGLLPSSSTSRTLSAQPVTGTADPNLDACSKQRRISSEVTRQRTPSWTAITASSSANLNPFCTECHRVAPPSTSRIREDAPSPSPSSLPVSIYADGNTSITTKSS